MRIFNLGKIIFFHTNLRTVCLNLLGHLYTAQVLPLHLRPQGYLIPKSTLHSYGLQWSHPNSGPEPHRSLSTRDTTRETELSRYFYSNSDALETELLWKGTARQISYQALTGAESNLTSSVKDSSCRNAKGKRVPLKQTESMSVWLASWLLRRRNNYRLIMAAYIRHANWGATVCVIAGCLTS